MMDEDSSGTIELEEMKKYSDAFLLNTNNEENISFPHWFE
jgi:hypothetical protein